MHDTCSFLICGCPSEPGHDSYSRIKLLTILSLKVVLKSSLCQSLTLNILTVKSVQGRGEGNRSLSSFSKGKVIQNKNTQHFNWPFTRLSFKIQFLSKWVQNQAKGSKSHQKLCLKQMLHRRLYVDR